MFSPQPFVDFILLHSTLPRSVLSVSEDLPLGVVLIGQLVL